MTGSIRSACPFILMLVSTWPCPEIENRRVNDRVHRLLLLQAYNPLVNSSLQRAQDETWDGE